MIEYLFGENSLFPRYKLACKNKDSRESKEAIKRGEFVENSHLWGIQNINVSVGWKGVMILDTFPLLMKFIISSFYKAFTN